MTELSPEAKKLFEAARQAYSPTAQRVDALQAALQARIAAEAAAASTAASASGAGATKLALAVKAAIVVGVATAVLVGASLWQGAQQGAAPSLPEPSAPEERAPAAEPSAAAPELAEPVRSAPTPSAAPPGAGTAHAALPAIEPAPRVDAAAEPPVAPVRRASSVSRAVALRRASRAATPAEVPEASPPTRVVRAQAGSALAAVASADPPRTVPAPAERVREPAPEPVAEPVAEPEAPTPVTRDALDAEIRLLRAARAALDNGAPARALTILEAHAERHPRGTLVQERLATRALALCALGRASAARAVVRELSLLSPSSPYLSRLRSSCAWPTER